MGQHNGIMSVPWKIHNWNEATERLYRASNQQGLPQWPGPKQRSENLGAGRCASFVKVIIGLLSKVLAVAQISVV